MKKDEDRKMKQSRVISFLGKNDLAGHAEKHRMVWIRSKRQVLFFAEIDGHAKEMRGVVIQKNSPILAKENGRVWDFVRIANHGRRRLNHCAADNGMPSQIWKPLGLHIREGIARGFENTPALFV